MLEDGAYEVNVIGAEDLGTDVDGAVRVEVAITSAAHRGAVVAVDGRVPGATALDLLGSPGTLVVSSGAPELRLDGWPGASMTASGEG